MSWLQHLINIFKPKSVTVNTQPISPVAPVTPVTPVAPVTPSPAQPDPFTDTALPLILVFEGGYTNNPNDHGGATNYGIIQREYDAWRTEKKLPTQDIRGILMTEVQEIYLNKYWRPSMCDKMAVQAATAVFDTSVNAGQGRSVMLLQQAVGAHVDGVIGPETLGKLAAQDPKAVANTFMDNREAFYKAIVAHDPTQQEFFGGWMRRVKYLRAYVNGEMTVDQIRKAW